MHKFLEYPATLQTLEFSNTANAHRGSVEARSNDGLMVTFSAQFQYQLNPADLSKLYNKYGEDYKSPCIRFAVDVMNDQATDFFASAFFRNITQVQIDMEEKLAEVFLRECYSRV
jgi:hypothetical protein